MSEWVLLLGGSTGHGGATAKRLAKDGFGIMDASRKYLTEKGYVLVCSSVCNGSNPYEDWWIDPYVVKEETYKPFECMGSEARNIFI